jgi:hypothetical protein
VLEDVGNNAASDTDNAVDNWTAGESSDGPRGKRRDGLGDLPLRLCTFIGASWTIGLYSAYPTPSTVPIFIGLAFILIAWTVVTWSRVLKDLAYRKDSLSTVKARYPLRLRIPLVLATALLFWWITITLFTGAELTPPIALDHGERYFIAVNLHNNEAILSDFIKEITLLTSHRKACLYVSKKSKLTYDELDDATSTSPFTNRTLGTELKPS